MAFTKKLLICVLVILSVALVVGLFPVHGESEIYETVVRLHVIANSDSEEDQNLKLKVRDRILELVSPTLEDCSSQTEAIAALGGVLCELEEEAEAVVVSEGYDYDVNIELCEEYYPTKNYESCAFPEGEYVSLKIMIGESDGENWWCCLFPPLCMSAANANSAKGNEDAFISVGLTGEQYKIVTETQNPKYKVRFKILEVFNRVFGN